MSPAAKDNSCAARDAEAACAGGVEGPVCLGRSNSNVITGRTDECLRFTSTPSTADTRFFGFLASLSNGKKFAFTAISGLTFISSSIWYLQPSDYDRALANLLAQQGYYELATPAELYIPGTINTIEVRSDGKVELHPTCKMDVGMLAKMTIESRTIDRDLALGLNKKCAVVVAVGMWATRLRCPSCPQRCRRFGKSVASFEHFQDDRNRAIRLFSGFY